MSCRRKKTVGSDYEKALKCAVTTCSGVSSRCSRKVNLQVQRPLVDTRCVVADICQQSTTGSSSDDGVFATDINGLRITSNAANNVGRGIGGTATMGLASVAGGVESEASADYSVAFGYRAAAVSGQGAFAFGERTRASGVASGNVGVAGVDNTHDNTVFLGGGVLQLQSEDTAIHAGRDGSLGGDGSDGVTGSGFMDFIPLGAVKTGTEEVLSAVEIGPGAIVRLNASVTDSIIGITHPGTEITLPAADELVGPNGRWKLAKPGDSWLFTVDNLGSLWSATGEINPLITSSTAYVVPPAGGGGDGGGWTFPTPDRQVLFSTRVRFQVIVRDVDLGSESVEMVRIDNLTRMPRNIIGAPVGGGGGFIDEGDGTLMARFNSDFPNDVIQTLSSGGGYSFPAIINSYFYLFITSTAPGKQTNIIAYTFAGDD